MQNSVQRQMDGTSLKKWGGRSYGGGVVSTKSQRVCKCINLRAKIALLYMMRRSLTKVRFEDRSCEEEIETGPKAFNLLYRMVESAGIEPASANPLQQVLHT